MNWASWPPVTSPSITALAPHQTSDHETDGDDELDAAEHRGAGAEAADFGLVAFLGARAVVARLLGLLEKLLMVLRGAERFGRHRRHFGERVLGPARHARAGGARE